MSVIRGNSCYAIVDGPTWSEAAAKAVNQGGYLVTINTKDEDSFIEDFLNNYFLNLQKAISGNQVYFVRNGQEQSSDVWIGLSDRNQEGSYAWQSGEPVTYIETNELYDDNGLQDYVALRYVTAQKWGWDDQENDDSKNGSSGRGDVKYSNKVGIAEIPLTSSIGFSTTPKEGAGIFTTSLNLTAGTGSNLANGVEVFWKITGIVSDDLLSGSMQGSGAISNGKLDIQHALKEDSDTGEQFEVSVYSDSSRTQQIGSSKASLIQEADPSPAATPDPTPTPTPSPTSVSYNISDATINEGHKQTITINRSGDTSAAQTISISTKDVSAISGSDYQPINANISFAAGASSATFEIQTLDDTSVEGSETFEIIGGSITGGPSTLSSSWGKSTGSITIADNDQPQAQLTTDYLSFTAPQLTPRPGPALAKFYDYVDRYPFTLKQAFIADYRAGKTASQHLWGQQHWLNAGSKQGRVLEVVKGTEDINDYGAYVENYGITLLDEYRKDPRAIMNGGSLSLFNWGKEHYNLIGKARGRQIDGGADFGAIIKSNPFLFSRWQDARIVDPTLTAFDFGHRNQNLIKQSLGVQLGQDTREKLTGQYVYGLGGNDVLTGTASDDILAGGFGDDLIAHGMGGTDAVYGGPGRDVFRLNSGGRLNIRDYRVGDDFIQLGNGLSESDITLTFDGINNSTLFMKGSEVLASVYGTNPNTFNFAAQSDGINYAFIA